MKSFLCACTLLLLGSLLLNGDQRKKLSPDMNLRILNIYL